jgi:cellulose synthase/poly-beta-1,6-N-acetylglucosamine synthase-like glycosyltransferase
MNYKLSNCADISVVVPIFNERGNIEPLIERIHSSFAKANVSYRLIVVDDRSTDGSWELLSQLQKIYPLDLYKKKGVRGKASSLLQGFAYVRTPYTAIIDADLQYPPEALPNMLKELQSGMSDVVVARRIFKEVSIIRKFISKTFRILFVKYQWRLDVDVQSGEKVFRSDILSRLKMDAKPWTFDLEFLIICKNAGYKITEQPIIFSPRKSGETSVHLILTSFQIGYEAIRLRFKQPSIVHFAPNELGEVNGFHYKGKLYQPYNYLNTFETAVRRFSLRQIFISIVLSSFVIYGLLAHFHEMLILIVASLTLLYFIDLLLNLLMVIRSYFFFSEETVELANIEQRLNWPRYTILCPMYKEAAILPQFTKAIADIDYPEDKLEILLLLEANDLETIASATAMNLPDTFKIVVVPHSFPKTKPKACNYGLKEATGEYAVIYDAEDIPDPLQLKKAIVTFERSADTIGCIQAKLNYYNWNQNLLTRLFTLEYTLWFNLVLPGLQSIKAPIPLGGTSNHFRVSLLRSIGGWDPFNVTEDADLGMRLAKKGYTTLILDSTTLEEANSQFWNWIRQRSRWIKGYIQTYFVHTRKMTTKQSKRDFIIFQLLIGGKVLSALINPLLWVITILYFVFRNTIGSYIHSLYNPAIFYLALTTLLLGNFLYLYIYMMAAAKRQHFELIITTFFVPFYWLMISIATVKAIYEFIVKPFYWQKTTHGLHIKNVTIKPKGKIAGNNE